jgi:hypothetical protein
MKPVISLLLGCLVILASFQPVNAQDGSGWREARTQDFAIIYPVQYEMLGQVMFQLYGASLDSEYQRFEGFFETPLQLPISIRIYPNIVDYENLNAVAPALLPDGTHSHIGSREIALMGENIARNLEQWQVVGLDSFRYELAILFAEKISAGKAPPGLLGGVGGYAQEPESLFETTQLMDVTAAQDVSWRKIWDSESLYQDPGMLLQAASIVAYLVDIYGWPVFLDFLSSLSTSEDYRRALTVTYGVEPSDLEQEWRQYYPLYLGGRWRAHALYDFDLSEFETLLAAGAYADTEQALGDVIQFLEASGQAEKKAQAEALIEKARIGQQAGALLVQARQALQNGDYEACLQLTQQAEEKYQQIEGRHRLAELQAYRDRAEQILALRAEADQLKAQFSLNFNTRSTATRLAGIGLRLGELGDADGQAELYAVLEQAEASQNQRYQHFILYGALAAVLLLFLRLWLARRKPPVEAQI